MRRRRILRLAGLAGVAGLAGCSSEEPQTDLETETDDSGMVGDDETTEASMEGGEIRIGIVEEVPPVWDTRTSPDAGPYNWQVIGSITTWNRQGDIVPHLATDWEFQDDGNELVFDLREGITFHDGSEFNAEHVKWHLTDFLANGTGTSYIVEDVDDVVVEDTHRARVLFDSPNPYIVWDLASAWGQIHSREAVEEYGDEYGQDGKVVSTGPFEEVEHDENRGVLVRNEDWDWPRPWQEELYDVDVEVRPERLVYESYTEEATRTSAFEAGDVDALVGGVPYSKIPDYEDRDDINTGVAPVDTVQMFAMLNLHPEENTSAVLAEELSLRRAISYAINRQEIVDVIFNGAAEPASNYLVPTIAAHDVPEEYNYSHDPERAREIMREDGWNVEPDGVSTKDGREASFTLITQNKSVSRRRSVLWQEHLKAIGVDMEVTTLDFATFQERVGNNEFAAAMSTFYDWGNADQLWWMTSESAEDLYYFNSNAWAQFPEATEVTDAATKASTLEERTEAYKEAHKYLLENVVPAVYDVYPQQVDGWAPHLQNYMPHYQGAPMWPVWSENW
jgi:peptide/nickel transport system substrate-binding protein